MEEWLFEDPSSSKKDLKVLKYNFHRRSFFNKHFSLLYDCLVCMSVYHSWNLCV
uniref:Uncharacterized protein n=1 Tax=Anguilla anguilla TaxID=7936 RepID=A0A0E9VJB4_ANGAN